MPITLNSFVYRLSLHYLAKIISARHYIPFKAGPFAFICSQYVCKIRNKQTQKLLKILKILKIMVKIIGTSGLNNFKSLINLFLFIIH